MPSSSFGFKVDNEAIGTAINEHVTTSLAFRHTGKDEPQPDTIHFNPADFNGNAKHLQDYVTERKGPYTQFGPVVASHFTADLSRCKDLPEEYTKGLDDTHVTTELFYNPFGAGPYPPVNNLSLNPYNGPGTFTVYVMLLRPEMRNFFRLDENDEARYVECYMQEDGDTKVEAPLRNKLGLPDYRALAKKDIATMTASVHEVLEITKTDDIEIALGPGDGKSTHMYVNLPEKGKVYKEGEYIPQKTIAELDPKNITHVKGYVTFFDHPISQVNGEYLAITHMEENHYHSSTPLARNLDVFGNDLGDRKYKYGLDPDTCEVKGTKGLCVVDAGMFPKVVYCHPIGSVMALAEWAADKICPEPK